MKQGFARVVVKWHLLSRGAWPPSTPWRQRPWRAARNLLKSRRSRPRATIWRPRLGRWKWLGWPAAGKLPLVHAGGRGVCGLVGGPGGVLEPYQNPNSCTWITIRLLRARPLEITQMALALVLRLRLDIAWEGAVLLYYGVMHELWHWMGGSASIGRKYTQMCHLDSPMEAVWMVCWLPLKLTQVAGARVIE